MENTNLKPQSAPVTAAATPVNVSNTPYAKKSRANDILMSFLPLIIMLTLNTVCTIPAFVVAFIDTARTGREIDTDNIMSLVTDSRAASLSLALGFIFYAVCCIVIFGLWYKKVFLKNVVKLPAGKVFSVRNVLLSAFAAFGLSAATVLAMLAVYLIAPSVIDSYSQIIESSGLGSDMLTTVAYGIILAPVAEELMFRGVTQSYLKRAGLKPAAFIAIQALLFGIAHLNVVQSTYAFFLGLLLGYICYKHGNIRLSILTHICYNIFGTLGSILLDPLPDPAEYAIYGVLTVLGIAAVILTSRIKFEKENLTAPEPAGIT